MGDIATPTPEDRKRTRDYAKSVVQAVTDDKEIPYAQWPDGDVMPDDTIVFDLSLEVTTLIAERDALIRRLAGGDP